MCFSLLSELQAHFHYPSKAKLCIQFVFTVMQSTAHYELFLAVYNKVLCSTLFSISIVFGFTCRPTQDLYMQTL